MFTPFQKEQDQHSSLDFQDHTSLAANSGVPIAPPSPGGMPEAQGTGWSLRVYSGDPAGAVGGGGAEVFLGVLSEERGGA